MLWGRPLLVPYPKGPRTPLVAAPWLRDGWRTRCEALVQPGCSEGRETPVLGGLCSATAQCQLPKINFSM